MLISYILDQPWKAMIDEGDYQDPFDPYFSESIFDMNESKRFESTLLYIGPMNSGTQFHSHSAAYNALIYGEKRWVRVVVPHYRRAVVLSNLH